MKRTVAKGFLWVAGTMALIRGARYLAFLVLGGVLAPIDFGRFAAIFVIVNGLALFQGFGLGHALICRRECVDESSDTIFLLSAGLGVVFLAAAWAGAPLVESLFGEEGLAAPFRLCAVFVLVRALQTVPARLFDKGLAFQPACVGDEEPRGKVVRAVEDDVIPTEPLADVRGAERIGERLDRAIRIQRADCLLGPFRLTPAHVLGAVKHLAVQVR